MPFFISCAQEEFSYQTEYDSTKLHVNNPVNLDQCQHIRKNQSKISPNSKDKHYSIELVGCGIIWFYTDLASRNADFSMICKIQTGASQRPILLQHNADK